MLFDLFIFGDHAIQERVLLKTLVDTIKTYPRVREKLISGSRLRLDLQPCEIKKILFMLVAHGILQLHYSDDTNDVIFQIAKSSHDETILVLQYDPYWISMNTYVNLTN